MVAGIKTWLLNVWKALTASGSTKTNQSSSGTSSSLLALEPRIMFDAAAVATMADAGAEQVAQEQADAALNPDNAESTDSTNQQSSEDSLLEALSTVEPPSDRREVVFVDTSVENYQELVAGITATAEIILIDPSKDGIEQMAAALNGQTDLDAIHVISHGNQAELLLGTARLTLESMETEYADELSIIQQALTQEADFLIYGCNFGEGELGQEAAAKLAELTGADIAASDDLTGAELLGGDWDLEVQTGSIETAVVIDATTQASYAGTLDITSNLRGHWTFDTDATDSSAEGNDGTLQGDAAIDTADATDIVGEGKLSLDGTGDYVDLTAHVADYSGMAQGTIAAWIKLTDTGENIILGASDSGQVTELIKFGVETGGQLKWLNLNDGFNDVIVYSTATVNDGLWHHVAVTVDASGHTLYIDGAVAAVTYNTGNASVNAFFDDITDMDVMDIGRSVRNSTVEAEFNGLMDDVRVYDRTLSATDIAELASEDPIANDDNAVTVINTPVTVNVIANDTDLDGETITVLDVSNPTNGTVVNNGDGTVTYTPDANYVGADSFTYTVADLDETTNYWTLDGNATDSVGGNNGTITGTTTVEGDSGNALSFDETDDKVVVSDFAINSEFSLTFKIKIDDNTGSLFQYIYSHGDINSTNSLNIFLAEASHGTDPNKLRTVLRDADDTLDNTMLEFDASAIIGSGNWHTYTLTASAAEGAKVYLDGVLQNTDATRGTDAFDPGTDIYFGSEQNLDAARFFGGALDSVQLFNRALSQAEVTDTHTGGTSKGTVNVTVNDGFVVNTTSDVLDGDTSSIAALLGDKGADGVISFREAILAANNTAGTDTITFNIPDALVGGSHTIQVGNPGDGGLGALPTITDTVIINGTTDPDFSSTPIIVLDGSLAGASVDGLTLGTGSDGSTIRGLVINQFDGSGIEINNSDNNTIVGNFIGTDVTGTADLGNAGAGVYLLGALNNTIGGTTAADRNLISGNQASGILRQGTSGGNVIQGNYIGTDITGTLDLGNTQNGIAVAGSGVLTIGGTVAGAGNLISGNNLTGIGIGSGASGVTIQGNYIGTNAAGTGPIGNGDNGISVNASNTTIGGSVAGAGNVISGNTGHGIEVESGSTSGTTILGNLIGVNESGNATIGNTQHGINLWSAGGAVTIGGTGTNDHNVIGGNMLQGILLYSTGSHTVQGNYIGTDVSGTIDLGNLHNGIVTSNNSDNNVIGGTGVNEGNTIAFNNADGLSIGTIGNSILGNQIYSNDGLGIDLNGGDSISYTSFESSNNEREIKSDTNFGQTFSYTSGSGSYVVNRLSIQLREDAAPSQTITVSLRDSWNGTVLGSATVSSASLTGSMQWYDFDFSDVVLTDGTSYTLRVTSDTTDGKVYLGVNDSGGYGNGTLLDVNGSPIGSEDMLFRVSDNNDVTANDVGDGDSGANNLQNYPVLTQVTTNGTTAFRVEGTLNSTANTTYRIEMFASTTADGSGYGEAERYLGALTVTTDGSGNATIDSTFSAAIAVGEFITATATVDLGGGNYGDTSEFAQNVMATRALFVDTTSDVLDGDTSSITNLLASRGADGFISLREAITAANNTAGADTINFNIGLSDAGHVYYQDDGIANSLTTISTTTLADGAIADFDPDYVGAPFSWYRMQPTALLPTITDAVVIDGTTQPGWQVGQPVLELNGTLAGTGTNFNGLTINSGTGSTVRGLTINQFDWAGIQLNGGGGHTVLGNFIGTDITGTLDLGNRINGIEVSSFNNNNVIGGTTLADRNVIAGNNQGEVTLGTGTGNTVQGNYLGVDVTGMNRLGNSYGLRIYGDNNQIGGTGTGEENVIAGIRIETSGQNNTFEGNLIGTDVLGTSSLGNTWGMVVYGSDNVIGGTAVDAGNVISGNSSTGVWLTGASATGNLVQGNFIGTDINGTTALGNGDGVRIDGGANNNTIGGTISGARNIISGNTSDGIQISGVTTTGNIIQGNYIGTDVTGLLDLGNAVAGIRLEGVNNIIGGTSAAERNVISGNSSGITIGNASATGNQILGNFIGTDATGNTALANSYGVWITAGTSNIIGGTVSGAGNVISGNTQNGVYLTGASTTQNTVQGNYIGTNASDLNIGNGSAGILVNSGAADNLVGGATTEAGNTIAYNSGDGIWLNTGSGTDNSILGNVIHSNTGIGIDLENDNVTANDLGDADPGANNLQNYPVLASVTTDGVNAATISGSLNSNASTTYRIEFFASATADGTGYGEAERYLGFATVTTDASGNATINTTLSATVAVGEFITATATVDLGGGNYGDTSEFAQNVTATGALFVDTTSDVLDGDTSSITNLLASRGADGFISLREAITAANNTAGADTINFNIAGAGPHTINVTDPDGAGPLVGLPAITDTVIIDGYTQPGSSVNTLTDGNDAVLNIILDGTAAGTASDGLLVSAGGSGSTIRGLVIHSFTDGIDIDGTNVTVTGNFIGTDATGTVDIGNSDDGIDVDGGNNTIGGTTPAHRNVISGNDGEGIDFSASASGNTVLGNYIGTDRTGLLDLGNTMDGIAIAGSGNTIGGSTSGAGNVISGNDNGGILIDGVGATGNTIQGNTVGADRTGSATRFNSGAGITVNNGAANNLIGGTAADEGNTIAFNQGDGIRLFNASGTGNQILGNSIFSNVGDGIDLKNDGVTLNDGALTGGEPNLLMDFPVLTTSSVSGSTLTVAGYIGTNPAGDTDFAGTRVEIFLSTNETTHGEGQTYLGFLTADANGLFTGAIALGTTVNVGDHLTATATSTTNNTSEFSANVVVTVPNSAPVNTVPVSVTATEDVSFAFTGGNQISTTDVDGNLASTQLTVSNGVLNVTLSGAATISAGTNGTNTLTISGSETDINATLASLTYQGTANFTGADTLTVVSTDAAGTPLSDTDNVGITVTAVNDLPSDLSSGIELNTDGGNDAYLIANNGGAILGGLSSVTFEIQFATDDTNSFTPLVSYATATNDNEFALVFSGTDAYLYIANNDILLNSIDYTSLRDGTLQHLAVTWDNTNGDWAVYSNGVLIEQGTGHEVGNTIEGGGELVFGNEQDALGGSFQSNQAFKGTYYDVRIWNDVRTAGEITQYDQQQLDLTPAGAAAIGLVANWQMDGLDGSNQVVDIVSGNNLSIAHASGTGFTVGNVDSQLSIDENSANGSHVGFVTTQDSDANETFSYSLTDSATGRFAINTSTGEITVANGSLLDYESNTSHNITVRVTDSGGLTYDEVLTIQVNDLEDTPDNSVPGAQNTNEDTTLTFNTANSNLISIADDAGETLVVTVAVNNGTVTLSGTTGLTFTVGDGTADATMTFSGTVENINAALNGLQYDPTADYNGSDTLTISTSDATLLALNLDANLQGYYEFSSGDPAGDTSPSGTNNGTLNGNATVTTDATRGDVLSLDGDRDYVNVNTLFSDPANVTLSAWVNYTSADTNGGEVITLGNDIALRVDDWSNGVTGFFWDGTTHQFIASGISLADGNWHHIAFTFNDTANTQTLYIDGTAVASASFSSSITYTGWFPQTRIGTHANDADVDFDFNGLIDDARIYDRALSASEIADLASSPVAVSDSDTVSITVDPVNDAPMNTVPASITATEDVSFAFTGGNLISTTDVDGNLASTQLSVSNGTLTVTLSGAATISAGTNGTNTLTISGTETDINATLASLTYQGTANYNGADTLVVVSTDAAGTPLSDTDNVSITVNAVNDAPVNTVPVSVTATEDTSFAFTGANTISTTDVDGNLASTQLSVSNGVLNVTLSGAATISAGSNGSATLTISGTETDINATLASLTYQGTANYNGADTLVVVSTDAAGTPLSDTDNVGITVNAVNDAPVNTVPVSVTAMEDTSFAFTGANLISTTDVDGNLASTQLSVSNGTLTVTLSGAATISAGTNGTNTLTISGSETDINATLASLTYQGTANYNGADTLVVVSTDAAGTPLSDTDNVGITVNAVNDAPVNTVPVSITATEDTSFAFTGGNTISTTDVDGNLASTQLSVSNGTLTVTLSGAATISAGSNGSATVTISGTETDINATLASLTYQGTANYNGADTLVVVSTDAAGTPLSDTDNVAITVNAVNDAPVNTVPVSITATEDTSFAFTGANQISTTDVDGNLASTQLSVTNGTLNVTLSGAATISAGTNGTNTLTISGSETDINATLASLTYQGTANYNGADTLVVVSTDAAGTPLSDTDNVAITVNAVNDAPVNTVPASVTATEDTSFAFTGANTISTTDVDGNLASTQLSVSNGTLTVTLSGAATISAGTNGTNTLTISGSETDINATLASLTYQGTANFNGADTLVVVSTDAAGTPLSDTDNVSITVNAVNDAPVNTVPVSVTATEDTLFAFTGANTISHDRRRWQFGQHAIVREQRDVDRDPQWRGDDFARGRTARIP